jgi:hypothetical protein
MNTKFLIIPLLLVAVACVVWSIFNDNDGDDKNKNIDE